MGKSGVNRREALRHLGASAIGAATSPLWVTSLTALADEQAHAHAAAPALAAKTWTPRVFTAWQNDQVICLTELIIPATETPGAKAALVNRFVDQVLADAPAAQRDAFLHGLSWIAERSVAEFGKDFSAASHEQQTALLTRLAGDERPAADAEGIAFFRAIKSMTISGYYSTEIGLRQELGDDGQMVLAEFHGCDHPEHKN